MRVEVIATPQSCCLSLQEQSLAHPMRVCCYIAFGTLLQALHMVNFGARLLALTLQLNSATETGQ